MSLVVTQLNVPFISDGTFDGKVFVAVTTGLVTNAKVVISATGQPNKVGKISTIRGNTITIISLTNSKPLDLQNYGPANAGLLSMRAQTVTGVVGSNVANAGSVSGQQISGSAMQTVVVTAADASVTPSSITATGLVVGDKVVACVNLTDLTDANASFENTITIADKIQQTATDLAADKILVTVIRG